MFYFRPKNLNLGYIDSGWKAKIYPQVGIIRVFMTVKRKVSKVVKEKS